MADLHVNKRYSQEEIEIIKKHYPVGGYKLVQQFLPHRTEKSISEKARTLKINSNNKKKHFSDKEIELLKTYYPIGGLELVRRYIENRSDQVIYQKASQLNLKTRSDLYTTEEDKIIIEHYPENGYEKVIQLLPHRTKSSIRNRAHVLGVKYLEYDVNYFEEIDTPDKAYWLGFMYTDGYVTTNNRWGISLSSVDTSHLEKFLDCFNCNVKIKTRKRKEQFGYNNGKVYEECSFQINNSKMHRDLIDKGVLRNKTQIMEFPSVGIVPKYLLSHFIRGLFDGDGSYVFYEYNRQRTDRNNKIYTAVYKEISFVCKSSNFTATLSKVLETEAGVKVKIYRNSRDDLDVIRIMNGEDMQKFIAYVYKNSDMHLDRKYEKAHEILEYCLAQ